MNPTKSTWGHYFDIDFKEETGEILDDAVYARNRKAEEMFNFKINVYEESIDTIHDTFTSAIMAGDDTYDAAYIRSSRFSPMIADGCLAELSDLDGLNLDKDWWDKSVTEQMRMGNNGELYFASGYFSLMSFDGTLCTYFNQTKLDDLGISAPYDLVRNGKWTLDELYRYNAAGSSLNGDDSFEWRDNGSSVYGLTTFASGVTGLIISSGANYITVDSEGSPQLTAGNSHFVNVCEKLVSGMTSQDGHFIMRSKANSPENYHHIFKNGRALMLIAQIQTSSSYRSLEDNFGIVPLPKYDENQENYISLMPDSCTFMCIPVTNNDLENTALLLDALAYISFTDVLPVYYEVNVSQKGLRNDDSIEMLDIIRGYRVADIGACFGWSSSLQKTILNMIDNGSSDVVSTIESQRAKIESSIAESMSMFNN
nr:extracellular solute-binding protein [Clostridia bacterium]